MAEVPWILISILILIILLAVLAVTMKKRDKRGPDYYTLFILGIIWLPTGIATQNYVFSLLGLTFMIVGIRNGAKWEENRRR